VWIRKGVRLIVETTGSGDPVVLHQHYIVEIRMTLSRGEVVRSPSRCLNHVVNEILQEKEDGFFRHQIRIDRENLVAGIFYAIQGMRVGGTRQVEIAPHLAYGKRGVPGVIPENAKLAVEIHVLSEVQRGSLASRECEK
jgi:hypothetical protein